MRNSGASMGNISGFLKQKFVGLKVTSEKESDQDMFRFSKSDNSSAGDINENNRFTAWSKFN